MENLKIENGVLIECTNKNIKSVVIPEGIIEIGKFAFSHCSSLKNITIPDSVTSISNCTFYDCSSLKNITIPDSVMDIGDSAFYGCSSLKNITIPDSIISIGNSAFDGCSSLKSAINNYKAVNLKDGKLICDNFTNPFRYEANEWTKELKYIEICEEGYHYCTNLFDIFNYYYGELNENIAIFICDVGDKVLTNKNKSKSCTNKIKLVRRLSNEEIIGLLNGKDIF